MSKIGKAAAVVSGGILLSRVLGFARTSIIASLLGIGPEADIYHAAFFIPDLLFYLMAAGFLSITFIPILSKRIAEEDERAAWAAFAAILRVIAPLMVVITLASMIWTEPLLRFAFDKLYTLFSGAAAGSLVGPELVRLTRIVLPAQFFFMVGSLFMGVQYTQGRFALPALAPIVYNASIIVGGLVGLLINTDGAATPEGFLWGALIGAVLGNFALQGYGARRAGLRWVRPTAGDTAVREYAVLALPLMLGQSIAVLDEQFVRIFGQQVEGGIGGLGYARALNMLPVGLVAQAAGIASYPTLARLAAEKKLGEMRAVLNQTLMTAVFLGGFAAAAVGAVAIPAVRVAFQRGSFEPADTVLTASFLALYALSIPFWAGHQLLGRGFYAQRRMWVPVTVGTVTTVLAVFIYRELGISMGVAGIAAASSASIAIYSILLGALWLREGKNAGVLVTSVVRSLALSAVTMWVGLQVVGSFSPLENQGIGTSLVALTVGGLTVLALFIGLAWLFKFPELQRLLARKAATPVVGEGSD